MDPPVDDVDFPAGFADAFAAGLRAAGWREFRHGHDSPCLTRDLGGGLLASAYAYAACPPPPFEGEEATFTARAVHRWQAHDATWTVAVQIGVGWEPAMALMPLLWLRPDPALMTGQPSDGLGFPLERRLRGRGQAQGFAEQAVQLVVDQAPVFAHRFTDLDEIVAALRDPDRRLDQTSRPINAVAEDLQARYLPILLALTGRVGEARFVLDGYLAASEHVPWGEPEPPERSYRRFARKLNRWIDADRPPPPPLSTWTDQDLDWTDPDWPSTVWSSDALDVHPPAAEEDQALEEELDILTDPDFADNRSDVFDDDFELVVDHSAPAWMQPPVEATYRPPATAEPRCTTVQLSPHADDVLADALTQAPVRGPRWANFDVWLSRSTPQTRDEAQDLSVHLGRHRIGQLADADTQTYHPCMLDARRFDEYPLIRAYLTRSMRSHRWQLQIERPLDLHPPAFL